MYQVRNGQRVVPTCKKCGCRLLQIDRALGHYYGDDHRDARGCLCSEYNVVYIDPKIEEESE